MSEKHLRSHLEGLKPNEVQERLQGKLEKVLDEDDAVWNRADEPEEEHVHLRGYLDSAVRWFAVEAEWAGLDKDIGARLYRYLVDVDEHFDLPEPGSRLPPPSRVETICLLRDEVVPALLRRYAPSLAARRIELPSGKTLSAPAAKVVEYLLGRDRAKVAAILPLLESGSNDTEYALRSRWRGVKKELMGLIEEDETAGYFRLADEWRRQLAGRK